MKPIIYTFVLSSCLLWASCGSKQEETHSNKVLYSMEETASDGLQRMLSSRAEQRVEWKGQHYQVMINRTADDSLPKVKDEGGDQFVDNTITLSIKRENGASFFDKTFTKQSFASVLEEKFLSHAILEGMVFDRANESGLVFAASVSYPQSDLFVPIVITIASNGTMTLRKEVSLGENEAPIED